MSTTGYDTAVIAGQLVFESKIESVLAVSGFKSTDTVRHLLGIPYSQQANSDLGQALARMAREGVIYRRPTKSPAWSRVQR